MKIMRWMALAFALGAASAFGAPKLDTASIERITGLKGSYSEKENVFKVSSPRTDVTVSVDGAPLAPFMGLTSWAAFTPSHHGAMVMGDIVLFEDEVNPVMSAALDNGLQVTALHNHFFYDQPKVFFMHIGGEGETAKLAGGVRGVLEKVKAVRAETPQPAPRSGRPVVGGASAIDGPALEKILGVKGQSSNGMFKAVWGRSADMHGTKIGSEMGVNTWAAFAGSDDSAVVDGDFAMREGELQRVLKSMRNEGFNVVAIHSHMTDEKPRILFLHYWAQGRADELAQALKRTLEAQRAAH